MSKDYELTQEGSFVIKNYNQTNPFSNFLPGIAGTWGVPMWVFYVNRAQGVISFGIKDKDHAITEFFPANKAYALAGQVGFRTFLKINNKVNYEPFRVVSGHQRKEEMKIRSAAFEIKKNNPHLGLELAVRYFTLPNCPVGGLVRVLSIKNISDKDMDLEVIDGLARIIPFGSSHLFLTDLTRTLEAWMRTSVEENVSIFRLIVDPKDASQTKYVEGANFNYAFYEENGKKIYPYPIVDPEAIFAHDTSFSTPVRFFEENFKTPVDQIYCGKTPCSLSHFSWKLAAGQERSFYSIFGATFKMELIKKFTPQVSAAFLREKEKENETIIEDIKNNATCVSSRGEFNHYIKATYLDNVLRGGFPYAAAKDKDGDCADGQGIYYIFSRKHGDLERDYNKFKLLPSYFSEGEANYRDINQNRRIDLFFNPRIGRKNIVYFLNFIKINGYNPLVVKGEKLFFSAKDASAVLKRFGLGNKRLLHLMTDGFYLGDFFKVLKEEGAIPDAKEELAHTLVELSKKEPEASHGEGYWIDHWFYNLDLIETYLRFYPDQLRELFLTKEYFFWDDEYRVKERKYRYYLKDDKVHQWHSVEEVFSKKEDIARRARFANFLHDTKGSFYKTHLIEKLLVILLNKVTTLDPDGLGIEMEADKPGWCDALNGLPALFGSSLCETLELKRLCGLLQGTLQSLISQRVTTVTVSADVSAFLKRVDALLDTCAAAKSSESDHLWWDKANSIKEAFRKKTFAAISSEQKKVTLSSLVELCQKIIAKLDVAASRAKDCESGVYFTYFSYEVKKYKLVGKTIAPTQFTRRALPLYLEGPMHALRVFHDKDIYQSVRKSNLFDTELGMYRLNASLQTEPLEIGRGRIFVPGWLENESIWLHMDYKYLLEVLRTGLYEEFFRDFAKCCVCYFDPQTYGRNILENSSFVVSSAHPDKNLWGKGFVARLSGATVELLDIWTHLCMGSAPFSVNEKGGLCIKFRPILKAAMFTTKPEKAVFNGKTIEIEKDCFAFVLFSSVLVVYHNPMRKDTFSPKCDIEKTSVTSQGKTVSCAGGSINSNLSQAVRSGQAERVDVYLR